MLAGTKVYLDVLEIAHRLMLHIVAFFVLCFFVVTKMSMVQQ